MSTATRAKRRVSPRRLTSESSPAQVPADPFWRLTVDQYDEMIRAGILTADDPVELLEGLLVRKMPKNEAHVLSGKLLRQELEDIIPSGWHMSSQDPIRLSDSLPEPDVSVIHGKPRDFTKSKPTPRDVGLVAEVSDSTLKTDLDWKRMLYARGAVDVYWVVNLPERTIEVFTEPTGSGEQPEFRQHQTYSERQRVPVVLKGKKVGSILVADVLP